MGDVCSEILGKGGGVGGGEAPPVFGCATCSLLGGVIVI